MAWWPPTGLGLSTKGRPASPKGGAWEMALSHWKTFFTDDDAKFDREIHLNAADIAPLVTWGTSPEDVATGDPVFPSVQRRL